MVRDDRIKADELVVCIVSGSGLKDVAKARAVAGKPLVIDPSIDAVRDALARNDAIQR
jgi:threonine synthase